jgi:2-haloacid dehalogenase
VKRQFDFSRFRVISFDCYGTLIDWETGILAAIRPIFLAHGAELSDPEILRVYSELELEAESREYRPYREVLSSVVCGFGIRLGFHPTHEEQQSLPDSLDRWAPFPDTVASLRRLKAKYQLAIISNVDDDLFSETTRRLEIEFDHVITAAQARAYKPSLQVFQLAEDKIGVGREQWLHAAQSIYHDVIPARSLGISTVWVNRASMHHGASAVKKASTTPDVEVHSLAELAQLAT